MRLPPEIELLLAQGLDEAPEGMDLSGLPGTTPEGDYAGQLFRELLLNKPGFASNMPEITPEQWGLEREGIEGRRSGKYVEDIAGREDENVMDQIFKTDKPQTSKPPGFDLDREEFSKRYDPSKIPSREERARQHQEADLEAGLVPSPDSYLLGEADPQYKIDVERARALAMSSPGWRPYNTPEQRGGSIDAYVEPLNKPGFVPGVSPEDLDFSMQQLDYMGGGQPDEDLDEWPETVEEFRLKFGRDPATDAEMEFYYPEDEQAR